MTHFFTVISQTATAEDLLSSLFRLQGLISVENHTMISVSVDNSTLEFELDDRWVLLHATIMHRLSPPERKSS